MLRILQARAKAGVEIKVIGSVARARPDRRAQAGGRRLHTRTIIRDRRQAFIGSQSLRTLELDSRRELGLIVQDAKAVTHADRDIRIRLGRRERQERVGACRRDEALPDDRATTHPGTRSHREGSREGRSGLHEGTRSPRRTA